MGLNTPIEDDGYRGWLRNPKTGRVFKANRVTAKRGDLIRMDSPDEKSRVVKSSDDREQFVAGEQAEVVAGNDARGANAALDELLRQSRDTDDKAALKTIGAQLGLKLTANMSEETMRSRIEGRIAEIQAAG